MGFIGSAFGGIAGAASDRAPQSGYSASSPGLGGEYSTAVLQRRIKDKSGAIDARQETGDNEFRKGQEAYIQSLQNQAAGRGPSMADQVYSHGMETGLQNQMALASSGRGDVNPAMLQRQAQQNQATLTSNLGANAMAAKAQEQLNAQGQLGQALTQARAYDIQTQQLKDQLQMQYESLGLSAAEAELQAAMDAQRINAGMAQANLQSKTQFGGYGMQGFGATMGALGGLGSSGIIGGLFGGGGAGAAGAGAAGSVGGGGAGLAETAGMTAAMV